MNKKMSYVVVFLVSFALCALTSCVSFASDGLSWSDGKLVVSTNAGLSEWLKKRSVSRDELIELELIGSLDLAVDSTMRAFDWCKNLTRVVCSTDSTVTLGSYTFQNCTSLSDVYISDRSKIANTGLQAFENCTSLKSITLPENVKTITTRSFKGSGLERVVCLRPSGLIIRTSSFEDCASLSRVELASAAGSIEDDAFKGTAAELDVIIHTSSVPVTARTDTVPFPDNNATIHLNEDAPESVRTTTAKKLGVDVSKVKSDLHIKSSETMLYDDDEHWYVCVKHNMKFDVEPHSYGEALADGSRTCTACGRVKPADPVADPPKEDDPPVGNDPPVGENENDTANDDSETDDGSPRNASSPNSGECGAGSFAAAALIAAAICARRRAF